jgi:hypothetical protein
LAFGGTILDASRALHAAALGNPYDAKWQCSDPKKDLRATDPSAGKTLTAKGAPEYLLTVLSDITLTSPIDPSRDDTPPTSDEPDERGKQSTRLVLRGTAFVFADGRLRWFEMKTRAASSIPDSPSLTRLKRLPPDLRGALSDLVTTLSSPSCSLPFISEGELATLLAMLRLSPSKLDSAVEALDHEIAELHHACEAVAKASGRWDARISRMEIAYRVGEELAILSAGLEIDQGHLCIGRGSAHGQ